jgi:hypothetical protein
MSVFYRNVRLSRFENKRALKTRKSDQGRNEVWALNKKGKEGDQEINKEVYKFGQGVKRSLEIVTFYKSIIKDGSKQKVKYLLIIG